MKDRIEMTVAQVVVLTDMFNAGATNIQMAEYLETDSDKVERYLAAAGLQKKVSMEELAQLNNRKNIREQRRSNPERIVVNGKQYRDITNLIDEF